MQLAVVALAITLFVPESLATTLIYTNDVYGDIEPCGCRKNPQGGMARLAVFLERTPDSDRLMLDGGDLLFSTLDVPDVLQPQTRLQAEYLVRALNELGQDAVVPGEKDFALGLDTFQDLRAMAKFKFLAANLLWRDKPLLDPHAIFEGIDPEGKPLKIGVFGLIGMNLRLPDGLTVKDPLVAAKREVEALEDETDLVIALTHQAYEADTALAQEVDDIDIIVGGHSQAFLQEPPLVEGTRIFQAAYRNQVVGRVALRSPVTLEGHELLPLDEGFEPKDSKTGLGGKMNALVEEFKKAVAKLNSKPVQREAALSPSTYQTFPNCAECHAEAFDFWRKTSHARALEPLLEANQIRNKECLSCHTLGLGKPGGYPNLIAMLVPQSGTALAPEETAGFLKNLSGAKDLSNLVKLRETDQTALPLQQVLKRVNRSWAPVQCEHCHAVGVMHPGVASHSKEVAKDVCLSCHKIERAPAWYGADRKPNWPIIEAKRAMIACPLMTKK